MTTTSQPRLSELVASATKDVQTLIRGEIQLAKAEVTGAVKTAGTGIGLAVSALEVVLFAVLLFAFALAFGIDEALNWPLWSGFAIVGLLLVILAAVLGLLGLRKAKQVRGPEQTMLEANKTMEALADRSGKGYEAGLVDRDL
ncbi:MAG TPA: phage holin family protein [Acidimicrobiales bacterium]|nr:phage holin family protein [Actinomycetes bacterium]HVN51530.1 phage holin family protein [Acidimicrobiales bacterium]